MSLNKHRMGDEGFNSSSSHLNIPVLLHRAESGKAKATSTRCVQARPNREFNSPDWCQTNIYANVPRLGELVSKTGWQGSIPWAYAW